MPWEPWKRPDRIIMRTLYSSSSTASPPADASRALRCSRCARIRSSPWRSCISVWNCARPACM
eukprot:scaffold313934_cov27-Tisochrysis_lutea.AAC.2